MTCSVAGCDRLVLAKELCRGHYQRVINGSKVPMSVPVGTRLDGSLNGRWKGGEVRERDRVLIYAPNHPYPSKAGCYIYRYRFVMEKELGRFLEPTEVVHHINGVSDDDRLKNLQLFSTQSEHMKFHSQSERWGTKSRKHLKAKEAV